MGGTWCCLIVVVKQRVINVHAYDLAASSRYSKVCALQDSLSAERSVAAVRSVASLSLEFLHRDASYCSCLLLQISTMLLLVVDLIQFQIELWLPNRSSSPLYRKGRFHRFIE